MSAEDVEDESDVEKEQKVYIEDMKPKTKEDFKKYAEAVYEEISRYDVSFYTIKNIIYIIIKILKKKFNLKKHINYLIQRKTNSTMLF